MALAVASTSTASVSNSDTVTVTKPTGVAVGDLLLIATHNVGNAADATCSGFTLATSNYYNAGGALPDVGNTLLYRIADSTDVAAANYVVNHDMANNSGIVVMLRVTGWTTGNPVWNTSSVNASQDSASFTLTATGLAITRPSASALVLMLNSFHSSNSPFSSATFSTYSITSGVANPTWTEVFDTTVDVIAGTAKVSFALAYAITTSNTDITGFSVVGASDTGGTEDSETALLVVINEPQSSTVDVSHLAVTPTIEGVTASSVNVASDVSHLAVTPTIEGIPTRDNSSTQWINENKPSTTWTNQNK